MFVDMLAGEEKVTAGLIVWREAVRITGLEICGLRIKRKMFQKNLRGNVRC